MKKNTTIIAVIAAIIVGGLLGFLFRDSRAKKEVAPLRAQVKDLQSQIDEAKKFFGPFAEEARALSGTVQGIEENTILVDIVRESYLFSPFEKLLTPRRIIATDVTAVVRLELKDPDKYRMELEMFEERLQTLEPLGLVTVVPPRPETREQAITFRDLKIGDMVMVEASENIKDKESFVAEKIIVIPPVSPPTK